MSIATVVPRRASWAERAATIAAFLASGLGIGAWAASIPLLKTAIGLSNGALSLALLAFAVGAVLAMQGASLIAHKWDAAGGTLLAMFLFAGSLLLPSLARTLATLVVAALTMGAAQELLDVLMNAQASGVERRWGAAIMSSFHAAFSLGGLAGAAIGVRWRAHQQAVACRRLRSVLQFSRPVPGRRSSVMTGGGMAEGLNRARKR